VKIQHGDILREATADESAFIEKTRSDAAKVASDAEKQAEKRKSVYARLGLTPDEITLLFGA
jgi:hypothetical protein